MEHYPTKKEIVEEIESYQKVIHGARMVIENYRPRIPVDPEWSVVFYLNRQGSIRVVAQGEIKGTTLPM